MPDMQLVYDMQHRPKKKTYDQAAKEYMSWLKSPEGRNATYEQQTQKRRQLLTPTNRVIDRSAEAVDKAEAFIFSKQAENIRRMYEFTRRTRPDLSAKSAFGVMSAENPNLFRGISAKQFELLYNRYVHQDPRRRGLDSGISNSMYDSAVNPNTVPALKRALYSGTANFTTNVGKPALNGIVGSADLLGFKIPGFVIGKFFNENAGRRWATTLDRSLAAIPTKTTTADSGLGYHNFDSFNKALASASAVTGGLIDAQMIGNMRPSAKTRALANHKLHDTFAQRAQSADALKFIKSHPYLSTLFGGAEILQQMTNDKPQPADMGQAVGIAMDVDPATGMVLAEHDPNVGVAGIAARAANPGVNTMLRQQDPNSDISKAQRGTVVHQVSSFDSAPKRALLPSRYDGVTQSDETPAPTPAPAGEPTDSNNTKEDKPKQVPWYQDIDPKYLWKGGAALGLGVAGASLGGWKGALAAAALGGLGYAYGDKLPDWWDKFMKAVNTK